MTHPAIGFIGCGRMASAIIGGLLSSGQPRERILVLDQTPELTQEKALSLGVTASTLSDLTHSVDIVFLCIKPQQADAFFATLPEQRGQAIWVSIMAGITLDSLSNTLGHTTRIVRAMPNTPALVQEGMTALAYSNNCSSIDQSLVASLFSPIGAVVTVTDAQMHAVTALSGSGPAFFMKIAETFISAGIEAGLSEDLATKLVLQTQIGSGKLANTSKDSLSQLIQNVSSPGGTTVAGLSTFETESLTKDLQTVIKRAILRSQELSREET